MTQGEKDSGNRFIKIDELFEEMKVMALEHAKAWAEQHSGTTPEEIDKKALEFMYYGCLMLGGARLGPEEADVCGR